MDKFYKQKNDFLNVSCADEKTGQCISYPGVLESVMRILSTGDYSRYYTKDPILRSENTQNNQLSPRKPSHPHTSFIKLTFTQRKLTKMIVGTFDII